MNKYLPFVFLFGFWIIFFNRFFIKHLYPIPADITVGIYFPWHDYAEQLGYPAGVPVKNPLPSDIPSVIYPIRKLAVELMRAGKLPDWNKYILSGTPLLANGQSSVFYVANLIYFLLPDFDLAWSWQVVSQSILASVAMYLLAHHLKIKPWAGVFSGITYAYSAFFITWLEYNIHGHVMALAPLIVLFSLKLQERNDNYKKYGVIYSLLVATQLFAGYPQLTIYTFGVVGLLSICYLKFSWKNVFRLVLFSGLGVLMASVQVLPMYDFLTSSNRLYDSRTLAASNNGLYPFSQLVTLIVPNFFGNPATSNYYGIGFFDNFSGYPGILAWLMVVVGFYRKSRLKNALAVLLLASFLLALKTPASLALIKLNLFGFGSAVASRSLFILVFSVSLLSGIGLESLWDKRPKSRIFAFILSITILAFLWFFCITRFLHLRSYPNFVSVEIEQSIVTLRNLLIPTAVIIGFWLVLALSSIKTGISKVLFVICILLLQSSDLYLFGQKYLTFVPKQLIFPATPALDWLRQHGGRILGGDTVPMNMWMPYGIKSASGYDALYSLEYASFLAKLNHDSQPLGRYGHITPIEDTEDFHRTSTRYLITKKFNRLGEVKPDGEVPTSLRLPWLRPVYEDKSVSILENIKAFPFVYFSSPQNPLPYREDINGDLTVTFVSSTSGVVNVSTTTSTSWQAYDNDQRIEISNEATPYIAVPVGPGEHKLILRYHPRWFNLGIVISVVSTAIAILFLLKKYFNNGRAKSPASSY